MNEQRLKHAVQDFYAQYPGGFTHPEMQKIAKKHRMEKLTSMAAELFQPHSFDNPQRLSESMVKMVSSSSMVSLFEKPKLRDYVASLGETDKHALIASLREILHGEQESGFHAMVEQLEQVKLAKWTLVTVVPAYYRPSTEVFVKPTTVKNIIRYYELPDLVYRPRPDYEFYRRFRDHLRKMKEMVPDDLKPSNAAFSGFLRMSMPDGLR